MSFIKGQCAKYKNIYHTKATVMVTTTTYPNIGRDIDLSIFLNELFTHTHTHTRMRHHKQV